MPSAQATTGFARLEAALDAHRRTVEVTLHHLLPPDRAPGVRRAIEASLFAPGKRLRPVLALMVAEALGGDPATILPGACSVEMVHTASLILDDLPSMDDATLRRGRPACHLEFGEATAILAAFGLLNRAYEILAEGWDGGPAPALRTSMSVELAAAVGLDGMIAGQAEDLALTGQRFAFEKLEFIHSRKTGALFTASAALGCWAARAEPAILGAVKAYAKNLGLAFQVVDDLIDVSGDAAEAGKDVAKDAHKTTFVTFAGQEGARVLAEELVAASVAAVESLGARAQPLRDLARYVVTRRR
jgi:geranylgeranyl diphosphate synthase type II